MPVECSLFKTLYTFHPTLLFPQQHSPGHSLRTFSLDSYDRRLSIYGWIHVHTHTHVLPFNSYTALWFFYDPYFCSYNMHVCFLTDKIFIDMVGLRNITSDRLLFTQNWVTQSLHTKHRVLLQLNFVLIYFILLNFVSNSYPKCLNLYNNFSKML